MNKHNTSVITDENIQRVLKRRQDLAQTAQVECAPGIVMGSAAGLPVVNLPKPVLRKRLTAEDVLVGWANPPVPVVAMRFLVIACSQDGRVVEFRNFATAQEAIAYESRLTHLISSSIEYIYRSSGVKADLLQEFMETWNPTGDFVEIELLNHWFGKSLSAARVIVREWDSYRPTSFLQLGQGESIGC